MSPAQTVPADQATAADQHPPAQQEPKTGQDKKKRHVHWAALALSAALLIVAAASALAGVLLLHSHTASRLAPAAFVTSVFFLITGAVAPFGISREGGFEREEQSACEQDCEDLARALQAIEDETLKGLAMVNFKQLRTFTVIAQRQARMSYYASLVAAAISLLVLTSGAAVAVGLTTTPAKITASTLAAAGTVLSGFLAKTFLRAYQMASRQMSYYYGQPLVHCYLLHAEWLTFEACKHSGNTAEFELLTKVIKASIKASAKAQTHLLNMQESNSARHDKGSADHDKRGAGHDNGPTDHAPAPQPMPASSLERRSGSRQAASW